MQKLKKIAVHLKSNMIMMIHTWKVLHNLASKASILFQQKEWSIQYYTILHNSKPFFPNLTSLEKRKAALFIARLAKRGACLTKGETVADGELIRAWSDDELSLTGLELQIGVTPHSMN